MNTINKKGQFYLFAAVILCVVLYNMVSTTNVVIVKDNDLNFGGLYDNYVIESQKVVNSAISENVNVTQRVELFSYDFMSYAKTLDPHFGIVYLLFETDDVFVHAYMDNVTVKVGVSNITFDYNQSSYFEDTDNLYLYLDGEEYPFNRTEGIISVKGIFRTYDQDVIRVRLEQ